MKHVKIDMEAVRRRKEGGSDTFSAVAAEWHKEATREVEEAAALNDVARLKNVLLDLIERFT